MGPLGEFFNELGFGAKVSMKKSLYFRRCTRQLKRLELVTKSPIFSKFEETINGLVTIRSLGIQGHFIKHMNEMLNTSGKLKYMNDAINRWLAIRIDLLAATLVGICAAIGVFFVDSLDPGIMSMTIVLTCELNGVAQ